MRTFFYSAVTLSWVIFLGCTKNDIAKKATLKLDYYTESYDTAGLGIQSPLKVQFEYDASGKISRYTVFGYNSSTHNYEEQRRMTFAYSNGRVDKIEGFLFGTGTPYVRDSYEYRPDARVSKITENNYAAVLNSEANFVYNPTDGSVKVGYSYSNGQGFEYEFSYGNNNIQTDKTTRGAELCSNGSYTYDQKINPFNNLGYVDYQLLNFSTNNKLTENVNYISCAFPALIPKAYAYEYNEQGYPTVATTSYKNSGSKLQRKFFYKID